MATKTRRTQEERSRDTARRLKDATIDLLFEKGFHRTTTPEIAVRAGLSRGALTHHFASSEELLADAIVDDLERAAERLHAFADHATSTDEIIDFIIDLLGDRLFYVTLEYLSEARHNADFKDRLIPGIRRFHGGLDAIWAALARRSGVDEDHVRRVMNATMCFARGLLTQTILKEDEAYYASLIAFWKEEVRRHFPRGTPAVDPPA